MQHSETKRSPKHAAQRKEGSPTKFTNTIIANAAGSMDSRNASMDRGKHLNTQRNIFDSEDQEVKRANEKQ